MKTQIILAIIIVILFALENIFVYQTGKNSAKNQIIRDTDTVEVNVSIPDSTPYKPKIQYVKEKVNIDSLFEVAKKYWGHLKPDTVYQSLSYIASLDSTYEDDLLKADINLVSRIPIDPEAYYRLKFDVKKELVFIPTYKTEEPSFWYRRFGFFAGIGGVYTQDGQADLGLFIGFGVRLN